MDQVKEVYRHFFITGDGIIIREYPGKRDYHNDEINEKDRIYRISIYGKYQIRIEDVTEIIYYLLKNSVLEDEYQKNKKILLNGIKKSDKERLEKKERYNTIDYWI